MQHSFLCYWWYNVLWILLIVHYVNNSWCRVKWARKYNESSMARLSFSFLLEIKCTHSRIYADVIPSYICLLKAHSSCLFIGGVVHLKPKIISTVNTQTTQKLFGCRKQLKRPNWGSLCLHVFSFMCGETSRLHGLTSSD